MNNAVEDLKTRLRNTIKRQKETLEKTEAEYEQLELLLKSDTKK